MRVAAVGLVWLAAGCRHAPATASGGVQSAAPAASASASSHAFLPLSPAPAAPRLDPTKLIDPAPRGKVTVLPGDLTVVMAKSTRPSFSYENWQSGLFEEEMSALWRAEPRERIECLREVKVRAL